MDFSSSFQKDRTYRKDSYFPFADIDLEALLLIEHLKAEVIGYLISFLLIWDSNLITFLEMMMNFKQN